MLVGGNGKETESGDLPAKGLFNCRKKKNTIYTQETIQQEIETQKYETKCYIECWHQTSRSSMAHGNNQCQSALGVEKSEIYGKIRTLPS